MAALQAVILGIFIANLLIALYRKGN